MSTKKTLVLLVVLAALAAGYWAMVRFETRGRQHAMESRRVFGFGPEDIHAAEVRRAGEAPVSGMRGADGSWSIVQPNPEIEANQTVWNRLAAAVAYLASERTFDATAPELDKYELDKPVLTVVVETAAGKTQLDFGAMEPTQTSRYCIAQSGEASTAGQVFLASVKAFNEMDRPLSLLRAPYLFQVAENEDIRRVEFSWFWQGTKSQPGAQAASDRKLGEESVVVAAEKDAGGVWRMVAPYRAEANQEMLNALTREVRYAAPRDYIDAPASLADYGLEPPKARLSIYTAPGAAPQTIYLGMAEPGTADRPGGLFARLASKPAVFVIDSDIIPLLPKTPDAFRERRLVTRDIRTVQSVHYVTADADLVLNRDPDRGWALAQPAADDTDQVAVSNFLSFLKELEGRGFPGDAAPVTGLDNPRITITLAFEQGQAPATVKVGGQVPNADQFYAATDTGTVVLLNRLDVTALTKTAFEFRNRKLLDFAKAAAVRVAFELDGATYELEKIRGRWLVKQPANRRLRSNQEVDALLDLLYSSRAAAVASETVPGDLVPFGLDAPVARVSVTTVEPGDGAPKETTAGPLAIGAPAPDDAQQRFALIPRMPGVYRVKQGVMDGLRQTVQALY